MSLYDFDIHPEALKEFRQLNDVDGEATHASSNGLGRCLANIKDWVSGGVPSLKDPLPDCEAATLYRVNAGVVLGFFATRGREFVLVHLVVAGTKADRALAMKEACGRAKEWFS